MQHRGWRTYLSRRGTRCVLINPSEARSERFPDRPALPRVVCSPIPEDGWMLQKFLDAVTDGDLSMMRSFESLRSGCDDFGTRDYVAAVVDRLLFAVNRPQRHQLPLLAIGPVTRLPGANRITDGMRLVFDEVALANDRVYRLAQVWCDREVLLHRVGEREGPHCAVTNRGSSFKRLGLDEDEYQAVVARRFGAERISVPAMKRRIAQTLNASNTPDAATA